jgi:hypothetical protein
MAPEVASGSMPAWITFVANFIIELIKKFLNGSIVKSDRTVVRKYQIKNRLQKIQAVLDLILCKNYLPLIFRHSNSWYSF